MKLYSASLLRESKNPSCAGSLPNATHTGVASNPLCGDRIQWTLRIVDETIVDARHHTRGCALCIASASLLAQKLLGRKTHRVVPWVESFSDSVSEMLENQEDISDDVLSIFVGLRRAPSRKTCVTLPWEGLAETICGS